MAASLNSSAELEATSQDRESDDHSFRIVPHNDAGSGHRGRTQSLSGIKGSLPLTYEQISMPGNRYCQKFAIPSKNRHHSLRITACGQICDSKLNHLASKTFGERLDVIRWGFFDSVTAMGLTSAMRRRTRRRHCGSSSEDRDQAAFPS